MSDDQKIKSIVSQQHNNIILLKNENDNIARDIKNITISNNINTESKLIDDDISNFISKKRDLSILDKDVMERKQRIKRRKLNLSTVDYTTEKFVDITSCIRNYRKIRLLKNKRNSMNVKIVGFINNNIKENENIVDNDINIDKYDQFWVIRDNKQLILGSWRR